MRVCFFFLLCMSDDAAGNGQAEERGRQNRQAQEKSRPSRLSDSVTLPLHDGD